MYGVVNEGGGTGGRARLPYVEVFGKTGSAQLASNEFVKAAGSKRSEDLKDNAWFEGLAPRSAPEIVVVALFEHGYRGQYAAPIVRDVLAAYFDKKKRLAAYHQLESGNASKLNSMSTLGLPTTAQGVSGSVPANAPSPEKQAPVDGAILEVPATATPVPATPGASTPAGATPAAATPIKPPK